MGFLGMERQNYANAKQAAMQMEFQRDMSNTMHQREVADLRAAGLNPILSANRGASTPSGAMAQLGDAIGAGMNTAMALRRNLAEVKNMEAMNTNIDADTWKKRMERQVLSREYNIKLWDEDTARHLSKIAGAERIGAEVEGRIDSSEPGEGTRWLKRFLPFFGGGAGGPRFRAR